jgi:cytidine deaminase
LVPELYPDSIVLEKAETDLGRVVFKPFVGIAPRKYLQLFQAPNRKDSDGRIVTWSRLQAVPRFSESAVAIRVREETEVELFKRKMEEKKLLEAASTNPSVSSAGVTASPLASPAVETKGDGKPSMGSDPHV